MMKAIDWKSILEWWGKMLLREEKKQVVNNEEKPVQSTKRLKNFLNNRFAQSSISVGDQSTSKHHTVNEMPFFSKYLVICSPYTSVDITGMWAPFSFSRQNPISVQITGYLSATKPKSASHCSSQGCSRFIGYGCDTYATFGRSIGAVATGVISYAQLKPAQRQTA